MKPPRASILIGDERITIDGEKIFFIGPDKNPTPCDRHEECGRNAEINTYLMLGAENFMCPEHYDQAHDGEIAMVSAKPAEIISLLAMAKAHLGRGQHREEITLDTISHIATLMRNDQRPGPEETLEIPVYREQTLKALETAAAAVPDNRPAYRKAVSALSDMTRSAPAAQD